MAPASTCRDPLPPVAVVDAILPAASPEARLGEKRLPSRQKPAALFSRPSTGRRPSGRGLESSRMNRPPRRRRPPVARPNQGPRGGGRRAGAAVGQWLRGGGSGLNSPMGQN
ncbi:hypothetical protein GUJ93_ZPchr0013g34615 [Zizania palustris]|uniref:Uncharacterized protein n=1 Tax=Zizania palustris TaxID=103762 RepID=A0A8J6BX86_ZIZPA|nr:hypothetical protein GUJ93_ZPchr0013g34615 [Zizania palustris]